MDGLADKTLVMIIGPAAVGKSTLMNATCAFQDDFSRVSGFTSRPPRTDDEPGLYRYVTQQAAEQLVASGKTVQHAVHPTTGVMYGTLVSDYPNRFNLRDTLSGVVDELRNLPFRRTITISLTTDPDSWVGWLTQRYPKASPERTKRLQEAVLSTTWSLAQTHDHYWLVNAPGKLEATARQLIDIATGAVDATSVPPEAKNLLQQAEILLSYE